MLQGAGFKGRRNLVVCFRERQEVPSWNEREREREREGGGERDSDKRFPPGASREGSGCTVKSELG